MNRRKRNTRGVTLAELCIVMAVIAIVSTMVVSFTVLMQARTRVIAADRDTVSDLGTVESALDRFIRTYDSDEYTIVQSDLLRTSPENPASSQTLDKYTAISVFEGENLIAKLKLSKDPETENAIVITDGADNVTVTYPLYSVTFVSFAIESNGTSALVTATVEYTSTHGSEQVTKKATLCHAVRAMKFVAASPDLETVKLAVSEFLKNYGTEGYILRFMRDQDSIVSSNSSSVESAYDETITAEKDNMCYVLAPKFSGGKIAWLHLYFYKTDTQPESDNPITTITMYPLCNITKIEYKTPSEGELTRPSSITCIVTYTDADGTKKEKQVFLWLSNVSVLPAEGGN